MKVPLVKFSQVLFTSLTFRWIIALDTDTGTEVAVKLEVAGRKRSPLKTEAAVYQMLQGEIGFPKLYWSGSEGDYHIMVMELLGHCLEDLLQLCGKRFSIATSFSLAIQMVTVSLFMQCENDKK